MTAFDNISGIHLESLFLFTTPASADFRVPGLFGSLAEVLSYSVIPQAQGHVATARPAPMCRLKVEGRWFPKDLLLEFFVEEIFFSSCLVSECKARNEEVSSLDNHLRMKV